MTAGRADRRGRGDRTFIFIQEGRFPAVANGVTTWVDPKDLDTAYLYEKVTLTRLGGRLWAWRLRRRLG